MKHFARETTNTKPWWKNPLFILGVVIVGVATLARVLIAYNTPVCPSTDAIYDDTLLMQHANDIRYGEWLGEYNSTALVKNPGYSMLMAAFRMVGLRYQLGYALLLVLACALAARAFRPLVPSRGIRWAMYLLLLYMPAFFTAYFFQRVYRNGAAIIFALLVFSSFVGLYLRRGERLRVMVAWGAAAGASLGFFSIIQESAAWVLPFALACTAVTAGAVVVDGWRNQKRHNAPAKGSHFAVNKDGAGQSTSKAGAMGKTALRLVVVALPFAIYLACGSAVSLANNHVYGVSLRNDKYEGEFARATADITSIDVGITDTRVWISNQALDEAIKHSPTLAQMEKELRAKWDAWKSTFANTELIPKGEEPQVLGDHPYWTLREAYAAHGGYKDAVETEKYWGAVAQELEQAFLQGQLKKKDGLWISKTTQPMPYNIVGTWITSSCTLLCDYARGDLVDDTMIRPLPDTDAVGGNVEEQLNYRILLGRNTLFKTGDEFYEDPPSDAVQPWLTLDNRMGTVLNAAHRVLLPVAGVLIVVLAVLDIRSRNKDGISTALVLLGLFLSAFVLVFGASWMISFLSTAQTALSAAGPAFAYCGAVYALIGLAECIVLGRVLQKLTDRIARKSKGEPSNK